MTPADVQLWAVDRGIGHAVAYQRDYYILTACGTMANYTRTEVLPARICRKCRERLRDARLVKVET